MRRARSAERERASFELRIWAKTGQHGLGAVAVAALDRAAERLGYADRSAASHDLRDAELYSEAVEDVESPK
jgi:hypothetical protein